MALTRTPDPILPTSLIGASDWGALTWGQMTGWAFDRGAGAWSGAGANNRTPHQSDCLCLSQVSKQKKWIDIELGVSHRHWGKQPMCREMGLWTFRPFNDSPPGRILPTQWSGRFADTMYVPIIDWIWCTTTYFFISTNQRPTYYVGYIYTRIVFFK